MIENKNILITGFAGSIGSELFCQLVTKNNVFGIDLDETRAFDLIEEYRIEGQNAKFRIGNVENEKMLLEVFSSFVPDIIFHCAARKHVSPMEEMPIEAVNTNIIGTWNLLQIAAKYKVQKFINISTDKVVQNSSVMGMTKRIGEIMVKNNGGISVRFANVLGSRGSVIPIWQKQIDERKPLTITHPEMTRYFMTIPQAVKLVIEAAEVGEAGDIIVLNMGQPVKVIDLAKKILDESGLDLGLKEIGIRPGESMKEELMTEEEKAKAIKKNGLWIIKS